MKSKRLYTKDEKGNKIPISGSVTREELVIDASGITLPSKLSELVDAIGGISENIPTKTSQLANDSNFLTEHQSLEGYAKTTDIPTTLPASDVSEWAKKPNKPTYTASEVGALPGGTYVPTEATVKSKLELDSVKANGNIVLKDGNGNKKEYMAATPSGDPMHYAYEIAGALYNDTSDDIKRTAPWGEQVLHKAGMWYMNGIGDITNKEILNIYLKTYRNIPIGSTTTANPDNLTRKYLYGNNGIRTNFQLRIAGAFNNFVYASFFRICQFNPRLICFAFEEEENALSVYGSENYYMFYGCSSLKAILGIITTKNWSDFGVADSGSFFGCYELELVKIFGLCNNINFSWSSKLNKTSILYMIANAGNGTKDIWIKLHPTAKAMADADADIQAALTTNGHISITA